MKTSKIYPDQLKGKMLNKTLIKTNWLSLASLFSISILSNLVSSGKTSLNKNAEIGVTIESLCANEPIELVRISQVLTLIGAIKLIREQQTINPCEAYHNSLLSLEDVLITVQTGKTCDLEFVDKIRNYHNSFIRSDRSHNKFDSIPKALKRFFIGLAFQINAACKINLINNLENDVKGRLEARDYETIGFLEENHATLIDDSDKMINDFDDVVRIKDVEDDNGNNDAKMLIKMKTDLFLKTLQETCLNKFKPFYSKLILPLAELSNLGYNYQGELLSRELEELKRNEFVKRWYNIVQTCESYEATELYYDASQRVYRNNQIITFISRAEADSLAAKGLRMKPKLSNDHLIHYEPDISHNSDELWILQQDNIENLIRKYNSKLSESKRIRCRLLRRLFERIKAVMKTGNLFKYLFSKNDDSPKVIDDVGTITISKSGDPQSIAESHLTMMEKVIEDEESIANQEDETAVSLLEEEEEDGDDDEIKLNRPLKDGSNSKLDKTIVQSWICGLAGLLAMNGIGAQ